MNDQEYNKPDLSQEIQDYGRKLQGHLKKVADKSGIHYNTVLKLTKGHMSTLITMIKVKQACELVWNEETTIICD